MFVVSKHSYHQVRPLLSHSFPPRRSSDRTLIKRNGIPAPVSCEPGQVLLLRAPVETQAVAGEVTNEGLMPQPATPPSSITIEELPPPGSPAAATDRKSRRLNSRH